MASQSLAKFHYFDQTSHLRLNRHRSFKPEPFSYRIAQKTLPSRAIRASSSSSSHKPSFLKTTCVTLTTAAALFSASLHLAVKPATATPVAPPPPSTAADLGSETSGEKDQITLLKEEEAALEKHLASHPNDVEALQSLLKIKFQSKNALEILNRLIEIEPEEQEWQILKAQVQAYNCDFDSAAKGFEEILAKDPFRVEAYLGLVIAHIFTKSESKLPEVESRIKEAIEQCKKQKKKKEFRGFLLLIEALRGYQELVEEGPEFFRTILFLELLTKKNIFYFFLFVFGIVLCVR